MNTASRFYFRAWRPTLALLSLVAITYLLYFHNLRGLVPGYSASELQTYHDASNWHAVAHNPLNAPYKLLVLLSAVLGHHSFLQTRLAAASLGVITVLVFYAIARAWYGLRISFLATIMFATSAGFLHISRLGSAQVLQMSILLFMAAVLWYRRTTKHQLIASYALVALFAVLWYVPGMIWLEVLSIVLLRNGLTQRLRQTSYIHKAAWGLLFLILISPLALAVAHTPTTSFGVAGLPNSVHILSHAGGTFVRNILSIGIRSNGSAELWVGHAPLLNVIELTLGAIGVYYYLLRQRSVRTIFLLGSTIVTLVLSSLGGIATFAAVIPLLYLLVASGLDQLLGQWLSVFPRNPIARSAGVTLICIMLAFSILYQSRSYFVAWPHNAATRATFNHPQP